MSIILKSESYRLKYREMGIFSDIPTCDTDTVYPPKLPKKRLVACYKAFDEPFYTNYSLYIADVLEQEFRKQYGKSVHFTLKTIDTQGSFFYKMSAAVLNSQCDFSVYATNLTPNRELVVDFICPYGQTGNKVLRGRLDPSRNISSAKDLNQSWVKIAVEKGTTYEQWVLDNAPLAHLITGTTFNETLNMVVTMQTHVFIYDSIIVDAATQPDGVCPGCGSFYYGEMAPFGVFLKKSQASQITRTSSSSILIAILTVLIMIMI
jgi:ABC-type amino acid transport substrate-binding protein